MGELTASYKMNYLTLRVNWCRFKTSGKLPLPFTGVYRTFLIIFTKNKPERFQHGNQWVSGTRGSRPIMPRILPGHVCCEVKFINLSLLLHHHHYHSLLATTYADYQAPADPGPLDFILPKISPTSLSPPPPTATSPYKIYAI